MGEKLSPSNFLKKVVAILYMLRTRIVYVLEEINDIRLIQVLTIKGVQHGCQEKGCSTR
jgi:hypothetical protein